MKKITILAFFIICCYIQIYAQQIEGRIMNQDSAPIEFANVTLLSTIDSSYVQGTTSNKYGKFQIKVPAKDYIVRVSFIGYNTQYAYCNTENAGDIILSENTEMLSEVTIKANKPLISYKGNKLVYNVKNMTDIQGLKATDILDYVPQLSVSPTDGIKVGNTSATVFINDRKLSQNEANAYLRTLNADEISTIEIQSMRGAEHAANIQGGVISIQTKGIVAGTTGTVQMYANSPRSHYYTLNPNGNIYWGSKNWNIYGSYSYEIGRQSQYSETSNLFLQNETFHESMSDYIGYTGAHDYKLGAMMQFGKKHLLMAEVNGNNASPRKEDTSTSLINLYNQTTNISDQATSFNTYQYHSNYYNAAISYKWSIDTKGSFLKLLTNYNYKDANSANRIRTDYKQNMASNIDETDDTKSKANNYSIQGDFKKQTATEWSYLIGGNFSHSKRNSDLFVTSNEVSLPASIWDYSENIASGYIGGAKQIGSKYYCYASLRVENTDIKGCPDETGDASLNKNYTNWIPYLYLSYTPSKSNSYIIAYTRTLYRPPFALMNNYINRISDVLFDKGNPDLKSSLTDVLQLQWVHKNHLLLFSYKHTSDEISEYFEAKDGITYHTNLNYGSVDNVSLGYYFSNKITSWWQTNISISGDYTNIPRSYNISSLWGANASMSNRFFLSGIGDFNANIKGYTNSISGNAYRKGYISIDIGYNRSFYKNKFNLRVGVNDIFNGVRNRSHTYVPTLDYHFYSKNQTRKAWVSLTYNFSTKNEVSKNKLQNENRVKSRL